LEAWIIKLINESKISKTLKALARSKKGSAKAYVRKIINHNFTAIYLVTMNSCTCPMLEELTKMIADEIKLGDRDVFAYK
jgi:hypothetical protein